MYSIHYSNSVYRIYRRKGKHNAAVLLWFLVLAAGNTRMHKHQAERFLDYW